MGLLIILFCALFIVTVVIIINDQKPKLAITDKQYLKSEWQKVEKLSESDGKQAILAADQLLGKTLELCGFKEATVQQQLETAGNKIPLQDQLNEVRKHRYQISNDAKYQPTNATVVTAIATYKAVLQKIGVFSFRKG